MALTGVILIYAIVVGVGGIVGFLKSGSKVSMFSGLASTALLIVTWAIARHNPSTGLMSAAVVAGALCAVFLMRLSKTRKFMPAGVMAGLSLGATILFIWGFAAN